MSHSFSTILLIRAPNNKIENDKEMKEGGKRLQDRAAYSKDKTKVGISKR